MNNFVAGPAANLADFRFIIQAAPDSAQAPGIESGYDTIWSAQVPVAGPTPLERVMLAEDKIYVVLAVVLIIWFGIVAMLWRTDRKIKTLERRMADSRSDETNAEKEGELT